MLRVLCLGNELLADDAFGFIAAERIKRSFPQLDVVSSSDSGFHLMDYLTDIDLLWSLIVFRLAMFLPELFMYCEVRT